MKDGACDILVTNGHVLTMNAENSIIENGAVAVSGDTITAAGPADAFKAERPAKTIDAGGGIILPGLINAHTHAAMTLFRGLADDLPLMTWLNAHIFPAESRLDDESVYCGARLACAEMILSGTTCFCDMYLFSASVARAAKDSGMRAVAGEVLFDFPSPCYGSVEKGFEYTEQLIAAWRNDPLITIAVEPHSPYLCSADVLKDAAALAAQHGTPLIIHVSETQNEVEQMKAKYGRTPVERLADLGVLSPRLGACHCVVLTDDDIRLLKASDVKVVHNPESNMKLASGIAPVPRLLNAGICVGLGTDGCSSNNNLDMLLEMDTAAKLHKVSTLDPTVMDAATVLKMATIDAARVLGLDHAIGSIEPGKKADIIIIDTCKPHLTPMYHPASHAVYAACGHDVACTIINGAVVMENRQLTGMDVRQIMADTVRTAERFKP